MLAAVLLALGLAGTIDRAGVQDVIDDINRQRARVNVTALQTDPALAAVALERANDMARRHYFAHVNPDGKTALDALRERAYAYSYAGENIALAPSVKDAERGLWQSPPHRENLLDEHFHRVGIAVVRTSASENYVVQVFSD
jgi:uncharacterized protein YkwD